MRTIITYKDGRVAEFNALPGNDALELDLVSENMREIFSIVVEVDGRNVFSAYNWRNDPKHV